MEKAINVVFDGPPSNKSGRFVEVETDDGKSISIGEWVERKDGYWALRITIKDMECNLKIPKEEKR